MVHGITNHQAVGRPPFVPRGRVLLVHEDRGELDYYHAIFQGQGFMVHACSSYDEGARCLESEVFDLIVVSQGSPAFEGRFVLERAMEVDRRLPVLVVARCLEMGCYLEAMQLGAVDYVVEPLTISEMVRVIETHLRPQIAA